jgi:hypothetical protein
MYHTTDDDDKVANSTGHQRPSSETRPPRPPAPRLVQLLPVILGDITFFGPAANGGWLVGWGLDQTIWPLTRGEVRGWIECHLSGRISDRQVNGFFDYLCRLAATCHAAAQCTSFCEKEKAIDELSDLISARFGGAK